MSPTTRKSADNEKRALTQAAIQLGAEMVARSHHPCNRMCRSLGNRTRLLLPGRTSISPSPESELVPETGFDPQDRSEVMYFDFQAKLQKVSELLLLPSWTPEATA